MGREVRETEKRGKEGRRAWRKLRKIWARRDGGTGRGEGRECLEGREKEGGEAGEEGG